MHLDLLSNLTKIILEIERSQQDLFYLRDPHQSGFMDPRHPIYLYRNVNTLSSDELSVVNSALEELDKCRLTLDDFRNKVIRNKIRVGEDATDK